MSQVRPFRLLGHADASAIHQSVADCCEAWAHAWFPFPPQFSAEICNAKSAPTVLEPWLQLGEHENIAATLVPAESRRDYASLLFDASFASGHETSLLAAEVLDACLADLLNRLMGQPRAEGPRTKVLDSHLITYGSGGCLLRLTGQIPTLWIALGSQCVGNTLALLVPKPQPKIKSAPIPPLRREEAVVGGMVTLDALIGRAILSVGDLSALAVGDVIRLDASLEDPVMIRTPDKKPVLQAHLGTRDGQKALLVSGIPNNQKTS